MTHRLLEGRKVQGQDGKVVEGELMHESGDTDSRKLRCLESRCSIRSET